jgi:hypothetical protein
MSDLGGQPSWRSEKMKHSNAVPVLILLMFAVGCGQSKQVEVTHKSDPPGERSREQYGDLISIPVVMAGSVVEVEKPNRKRIMLVPVECGDVGKGGGDQPCYKGCERIRIRGNFEAKLGLKKSKIGPVLDKWEAFFIDDYTVDSSGNWNEIEICIEAWKGRFHEFAPEMQLKVGDQVDVGVVTVTVKPGV